MEFLADRAGPRPWTPKSDHPASIRPLEFFMGQGRAPLEVAVATSESTPSRSDVKSAWKARQGKTPSPLLLVVLHGLEAHRRATLCGPIGAEPPVYSDQDASQAERIAAAALDEPDRHAAIRMVRTALAEAASDLPGIHNEGMFATHELRAGVPDLPGWAEAEGRGRAVLHLAGRELVSALGFEIEARGPATSVLRIKEDGTAAAVAIFLDSDERADAPSARFQDSPVSTALARAKQERLDYVVLTRGREIRIYGATATMGVGRRGRAETFIEANLALVRDDQAGYLPLLFGADALRPGGTFAEILERSRDFASELGGRLRNRIYDHVVPLLATAVARARQKADGAASIEPHLDEIYESAMVLLFRLLFIAYGEDKGLLPSEANELYRANSLKGVARSLAERANAAGGEPAFDAGATILWERVKALWHAIDCGSQEWGVPLYNGGLFSRDPDVSAVGARLARYQVPNEEFGPALFYLLVDKSEDDVWGPIDFRALSVREFGTVYEGLLESTLAVAETDLTVGPRDLYEPAGPGSVVKVDKGGVYLQTSGARKATGSYYTPHFAVEYLLDRALEPALGRHLDDLGALIDGGKEHEAARNFFNFRVADISMGSGHFLVAAVDRIEVRLSDFLEHHPLPEVGAELERLKETASEKLGDLAGAIEIERASLLRRQIARRCIYGVDVNQVAVELARLSLWIHTFVPGLPLSFLDRTLVHGDSLFGAANAAEARALLSPHDTASQADLFGDVAAKLIAEASEDLEALARSSDATESEVKGAREAYRALGARLRPLRESLDIAVASTVSAELAGKWGDSVDRLLSDEKFRVRLFKEAQKHLLEPPSVHFPLAFPEVFYRGRDGFDCIVGNPPWEEVTVEHDRFWLQYIPGLQGMKEAERKRLIGAMQKERPTLRRKLDVEIEQAARQRAFITTWRFPGMGTGDADLYRAFAWRFLRLADSRSGTVGVVIPRGLFQAAGSTDFRRCVLDGSWSVHLTVTPNSRGWIFPGIHYQNPVPTLLSMLRATGSCTFESEGPYTSLEELQRGSEPVAMPAASIGRWNPSLVIPILPDSRSAEILDRAMEHPRVGDALRPDFEVRAVSEFHGTNDKVDKNPTKGVIVIAAERPKGLLPVIGGEAFDHWTFDPSSFYGWADPAKADQALFAKRARGARNKRSAFYGLPPAVVRDITTLPNHHSRIAFRDVTNRTNSRTMIVGVVPESRYLTNAAPYFLWRRESPTARPYLLGVLASRPFDWVVRRYVEMHVNFYLLDAFPVPLQQGPLAARIAEIALDLSCQQPELGDWAQENGRGVRALGPDEQDDRIAELDAVAALHYGLMLNDLNHIFETFHVGWDYHAHAEAAARHYERWAEEAGRA